MIELNARTFYANVYIGLRERYDGPTHDISELKRELREWTRKTETRVSVTPTEFVYTGDWEPGAIVGFINYPRFPSAQAKIRRQAKELAKHLMKVFHQFRASVEFPDETITFDSTVDR